MKFGTAMRKDTITVNADESFTVKGGGWFWVRVSANGRDILEQAPGMAQKKAARLFCQEAKLTVQKHFIKSKNETRER